jgi:hypothetical protein
LLSAEDNVIGLLVMYFTVSFAVYVKSQQISIQWEVMAQYHTLQAI